MSTTAAAKPAPAASKSPVQGEIETFRQLVIAAKTDPGVGPDAVASAERLNAMYAADKDQFTPEDVRWLNVLRGYLGARLEGLKPKEARTKKAKRKGDQLDHCWRCLTPVDERFAEMCPTCSSKAYQWRACPVCQACGCQRAGTVLM